MEIIRVANKEELQACFHVRLKVFVEEQKVPEHLEMDEKDESPEACHHILIEVEGQSVATARWYFYKPNTAKFQRVAVVQEYRGRGLGKRLIEEMEAQARQLNAEYAILDSQCHAEGFYGQLGYTVISEEPFYEADILHVRMQKPLK